MADMRSIWKGDLSFGLVNVPVKVYWPRKATTANRIRSIPPTAPESGTAASAKAPTLRSTTRKSPTPTRPTRGDGDRHQRRPGDAAGEPVPGDLDSGVRAARAGRPDLFRQTVLPRTGVEIAEGVHAAGQGARADRPAGRRRIHPAQPHPARGGADHRRRHDAANPAVARRGAAPEFKFLDTDVELRPQELDMAASLIETMATDFDPSRFEDKYQHELSKLIEAKSEGGEAFPEIEEADTDDDSEVADLLAALRARSRTGPRNANPMRRRRNRKEGARETDEPPRQLTPIAG